MSDPVVTKAPAPAATFARSIKMVAWSFLGIRKNSEYQQDLARVNPLHVIVVAIVGVLVFVVSLVVLVNWVVAK
jgi:amino acid transporter